MGAFADGIAAYQKKVMQEVNQACYSVSKELFTNTIKLTPSKVNPGKYATGLLANQWWPAEGGSFNTAMDGVASVSGASSLARVDMLSGTQFLGKDGSVTLTNSVQHAYRAEYLGWPLPKWSGGASGAGYQGTGGPYRMVATSVQMIVMKYK